VERTLGERLRWLRQKRRMSLDQLASAAGISRAYLWKLERKPDANPSIELLDKLAKALGVPPAELLGAIATQRGGDPALPEELVRCKDDYGLSESDARDLAQISFRGRRPTTAEEWYLLYLQLKQMLGDESGARQ
jgi:transcriptional regulator with XRE-family HTH domain